MCGDPTELKSSVGLVLRDIDADILLGGADDASHMCLPCGSYIGIKEIGLGLVLGVEPVGEGEVPERNQGFDSSFAALSSHLCILS